MPKQNAIIILLFLSIFGILALRGYGWYQHKLSLQESNAVSLSLRLTEPVRMTPSNCIIEYQGEMILVKRMLCATSGLVDSRQGDEINVVGSYKLPSITDQTGQKGWFIADSVAVSPLRPIPLISPWWWFRTCSLLHNRLVSLYRQTMPEPQASLVAGIVVGEQATLPDDFENELRLTGTMHLVAASGYNVTVVTGLVLSLVVGWWGRRWGILITGLAIIGYILLAGASPPVIRAGMMGLVMLLSVFFGRVYWSLLSLALVSVVMLLCQPWLVDSLSFQLSLAATIGIILVPKCKPYTVHNPIFDRVINDFSQSLSTTIAAVVMTAPLSMSAFGSVSALGLLVNPLVLWIVPPLMYLGGLQSLLGLVWFPFASFFAWLMTPLATLLILLIHLFSQIPIRVLSASLHWSVAMGWWMVWIGWWSRKS